MKRLLAGWFALCPLVGAHAAPLASPCTQAGPTAAECDPVNSTNPMPVQRTTEYPVGAVAITGNAAGTTGAVVGTLAAATGKTTFICGLDVEAIGGTAAVGPITVAGLIGSSMVFQGSSSAAGGSVTKQFFTPCLPASAVNTAITVTTTADGTATAVDVNAWGYRF